jgi:hypothetical protein
LTWNPDSAAKRMIALIEQELEAGMPPEWIMSFPTSVVVGYAVGCNIPPEKIRKRFELYVDAAISGALERLKTKDQAAS